MAAETAYGDVAARQQHAAAAAVEVTVIAFMTPRNGGDVYKRYPSLDREMEMLWFVVCACCCGVGTTFDVERRHGEARWRKHVEVKESTDVFSGMFGDISDMDTMSRRITYLHFSSPRQPLPRRRPRCMHAAGKAAAGQRAKGQSQSQSKAKPDYIISNRS